MFKVYRLAHVGEKALNIDRILSNQTSRISTSRLQMPPVTNKYVAIKWRQKYHN